MDGKKDDEGELPEVDVDLLGELPPGGTVLRGADLRVGVVTELAEDELSEMVESRRAGWCCNPCLGEEGSMSNSDGLEAKKYSDKGLPVIVFRDFVGVSSLPNFLARS